MAEESGGEERGLQDILSDKESFESILAAKLFEAEHASGEKFDSEDTDLDGLSEAEQDAHIEAISEWLRQRWGEYKDCVRCGNNEWWIGFPFRDGSGHGVYPVICRYCGDRVLLTPHLADLFEPQHSEPQK